MYFMKRNARRYLNIVSLVCFFSLLYLAVTPPVYTPTSSSSAGNNGTGSLTGIPSPLKHTGKNHNITDFSEYEILTNIEINHIANKILRQYSQLLNRILYAAAAWLLCLGMLNLYIKCFIREPDRYLSVLIRSRGGHAPPQIISLLI
jgi:hypothetical protein